MNATDQWSFVCIHGLLLRHILHFSYIHEKSAVFFYLRAELCQHVCAGHYCQVSVQNTTKKPSSLAVACSSYHCWIIGTCYSDFLKYSTIATPQPYAYTQLSRCDAGVLSCVSLLPDLLCHLSYYHTVHHCECGKHMLITIAYISWPSYYPMAFIHCTDSCSNIQQLLWCSEAEVQESFTTQEVTAFM